MPSINKPHKKRNYTKHNKNKEISTIYNSKEWKGLRNGYFLDHPLCEKCLEKGIIKSAEEVHHIKPISRGKDLLEMKEIAYNPDNLMSLCKDCHHKIHQQLKRK